VPDGIARQMGGLLWEDQKGDEDDSAVPAYQRKQAN
jgi:hypothetical protein